MKYLELPIKKMKLSEIPFYHRHGAAMGWNSFIYCGSVKRGGNEPYCYPEEKQVAGHVCRVLGTKEKIFNKATVIRDDGTVWIINFDCFTEIYRIEIE